MSGTRAGAESGYMDSMTATMGKGPALLQRTVTRIRSALGFALIWVLSAVLHGVRFTHSATIPRSGPVLIVANHLSTTEAFALARLTIGHRRFPHFLVKAEVFGWPVVGSLARACRQIPVRRESTAAASALEPAAAELAKGHVVVMYPEGRTTRNSDLRPGPAKTGVARLALGHPDVPVVPVGMWGPRPGPAHIWHRHLATMLVGEPVDLSPWTARTDQQAQREATDAVMAAITVLVEELRGAPFTPAGR